MTDPNPSKRTRWRSYALLCLILTLTVLIAGRGAGRWLIHEDPLASADVIVILSGGLPYRAIEAANVFAAGSAPEIWISRPENPPPELERLGIQVVGEEEYDREVLARKGIPQSAVHTLPDPSVNTEQEVQEIAREMRKTGKSRVIIVTSPPHTRRVRTLWSKLVGTKPEAIVRAAFEDPYDANHWWRNTRDALSVLRETLGLLNAWAGLPVRPRS